MSKQLSVRKPKQIQTKGNMHSNLSFLSSTTQTITKLFIFKLRTAESGALNKEKKIATCTPRHKIREQSISKNALLELLDS